MVEFGLDMMLEDAQDETLELEIEPQPSSESSSQPEQEKEDSKTAEVEIASVSAEPAKKAEPIEPAAKPVAAVKEEPKAEKKPEPKKNQDPFGIRLVHCKLSKKLSDVVAIQQELVKSQTLILDIEQKDYDHTIMDSLWKAAIIHYMKAFSSSRGTFSLQISKCDITTELASYHKDVIEKQFKQLSQGDALSNHLQTILIVDNKKDALENIETVSLVRSNEFQYDTRKLLRLVQAIQSIIDEEHKGVFEKVFEKYAADISA